MKRGNRDIKGKKEIQKRKRTNKKTKHRNEDGNQQHCRERESEKAKGEYVDMCVERV